MVDDLAAQVLARDIAKQVEEAMESEAHAILAMRGPHAAGLDEAAAARAAASDARIEAPADGVALVTVLGSRLIDMVAVPVTAGAPDYLAWVASESR